MLNIKFSKLKQVYGLPFITQKFSNESKYAKNHICSRSLVRRAVNKSTDTSIKHDRPHSVNEVKRTVQQDLLEGCIVSPKYYVISRCIKCESVISKLFGTRTHMTDNEFNNNVKNKTTKVHATTVTIEEEKLAQKIESVDETPHVEAHPQKIDGFNSLPKILGQDVSKFKPLKQKYNTKGDQESSIDELAKRCLDVSIAEIDNALLKELKSMEQTVPKNPDLGKISYNLCNKPIENDIVFDNSINSIGSDKGQEVNFQLKVEKIQPRHLDTLPLFTIDNACKDFKASEFRRDPFLHLSDCLDENMKNFPSKLSPYDHQAIPFYEYSNKEYFHEDDVQLRAATITETIQETEFDATLPEQPLVIDPIKQKQSEDQQAENVSKFKPLKEKYNTKGDQESSIDELATRCLDVSIAEIDNALLKELKSMEQTEPKNPDLGKISYNLCNKPMENGIVFDNSINSIGSAKSQEVNFQHKIEKIQPRHLDTLPLFTIDNASKDFKASEFIRDPFLHLSDCLDENMKNFPSKLSPYDHQAIPFYEYSNKEYFHEDDVQLRAATITETIQETEFDATLPEQPLVIDPIKQKQSEDQQAEKQLFKKSTVYNLHDSLQPKSFEKSETGYVSKSKNLSNIISTYRLYTDSDQSRGWQSKGESPGDSQNTAISGTYPYPARHKNQQVQLPTDSAISSNQNPGEYFDWRMPVHFSPYCETYNPTPTSTVKTENTVSQNITLTNMGDIEISKDTPKSNYDQQAINTLNVRSVDVSDLEKRVPLSVLLKQIQEQNRLEFCRNAFKQAEAESVRADKRNCSPPSCPPPKPTPCPPVKKPKKCPNPCKCPTKKDPCAKIVPFFINMLIKTDTPIDVKIPTKCLTIPPGEIGIPNHGLALLTEDIIVSLNRLSESLKISTKFDNSFLKFARDFKPWVPIPSLPFPKIEKKRPFVCPKEGCKTQEEQKDTNSKQDNRKQFSIVHLISTPFNAI